MQLDPGVMLSGGEFPYLSLISITSGDAGQTHKGLAEDVSHVASPFDAIYIISNACASSSPSQSVPEQK